MDPLHELREIEAIKQLKYRYMRGIDEKLWSQMEDCFTETATCAYSGGRYAFEGRDTEHGLTIHGAAFYRDEYVKQDGEWKIQHTGYTRTFEQMQPRADVGWRITQRGFSE
jgi:hypothetical protein